eukprot:TRINITY_DN12613_c0_g1_i1.p1 TRINITY_DN12613_c0_g1~~TRINITY_DN12613_c0_g1_i1.p1  ORF type:complete len:438 (+),score=70.30 TRINITY_DN12613_c0_g1_i1:51-1316(+)
MRKGSWVEVEGLKLEQFLHLNGLVGKIIEEGDRCVVDLEVGKIPLLQKNLKTHPVDTCYREHSNVVKIEPCGVQRGVLCRVCRQHVEEGKEVGRCPVCEIYLCANHRPREEVIQGLRAVSESDAREKNEELLRLISKMKKKLEHQHVDATGLKTEIQNLNLKLKEKTKENTRLEGLYNTAQTALKTLRDDESYYNDAQIDLSREESNGILEENQMLKQKVKNLTESMKGKESILESLKRQLSGFERKSTSKGSLPAPKAKSIRGPIIELCEKAQELQSDPLFHDFVKKNGNGARMYSAKVDLVVSLSKALARELEGGHKEVSRQPRSALASKRTQPSDYSRSPSVKSRTPSPSTASLIPRNRSRSPGDTVLRMRSFDIDSSNHNGIGVPKKYQSIKTIYSAYNASGQQPRSRFRTPPAPFR